MWRSKRFLVVGLLAAVVLLGVAAGVVFTQTGTASAASDNTTSGKTLLARVATILGIDQQKVEDAFTQARNDMQQEALDARLKQLVDQGKITQQQADQYKAWLKAKPDMTQYQQQLKQWQQARPGIPPEMKQWQEARPNMPMPGFGARGFHGGMRMGRGGYF